MNDLFSRLGEAQDRAVRAALAVSQPEWRPQSPTRERSSFGGGGAVVLAAGLAVAAAVAVVAMKPRPTVMTVVAGALPVEERTTLAATDVDVPLHFSDGSEARLLPGTTGRVVALQRHGAEVELIDGRLAAHIVHADRTRWVFRAGPFSVLVTGTRFDVAWSAQSRRLSVALHEGGVTVEGAALGAGLPLRAGQELTVALEDGSVRVQAMAAPSSLSNATMAAPTVLPPAYDEAAPLAGEVARDGGPARPGPSGEDVSWHALAERGAHAEAWRLARRTGIDGLRQRLDAEGLLALADVARYVGASDEARAVFLTLVRRFPRHHLAGDAVFSLGRSASESGDFAAASTWFSRYRRDWPRGALIADATGRLLEAALARGDKTLATEAARDYLVRAPDGPFAALARKALAETP
ncbi:MAG TPA: tetratricopeptide repeat protein [Polyangia bacterium]